MTPQQKMLIKISLVLLVISMVVMAASTVIRVIEDGLESLSIVNVVPFIGIGCALIAILTSSKKKGDK